MEKAKTPACSREMSEYFNSLSKEIDREYKIAAEARAKGFDPEERVDVLLARNMAERVEGLISVVAPQLVGKGVPERIYELEQEYRPLSWEVALLIAEEVAKEKFCKFKDKREAMEVGIRTGFAYHTVGIVSAPLEGFVELQIKKRKDGREYLAMCYAGPIRAAGGTAASFSVILGDYIRKAMGYEKYDPTENEINRIATEIDDYHERVTNLQYHPTQEEVKFLARNLPVEVTGDPTEKIEASNYKNLPRVPTNRLRGGMCLVMSEGISQKAAKLYSQLSRWGKKFGIDWEFLGEFLELQKEIRAKGDSAEKTTDKKQISPDYTFIVDLVGGRPVLTHPLAHGGFRLRYGRSRLSGYSAASIHPSTMAVLDDYVAIGTQLKVERPGKATAITSCDSIEPPIVLLNDGRVLRLDDYKEAKRLNPEIKEILYLGDILFSYGDFLDRAHLLIPCGYCEEWHVQEIKKAAANMFGTLDIEKLSSFAEIKKDDINNLLKNPLKAKLSAAAAISLSEKLNVPLSPRYTYYWTELNPNALTELLDLIEISKIEKENEKTAKILIPLKPDDKRKRHFELIGIPHFMATEDLIIEKDDAEAFLRTLGIRKKDYGSKAAVLQLKEKIRENSGKPILDILEIISGIKIMDKSGTFIGARMGRPEKAKMRKLIGAPHVLFPVGEEGGRMRSFQSVLESGKINADFPLRFCTTCSKETIFNVCGNCGNKSQKRFYCQFHGIEPSEECKIYGKNKTFTTTEIDFKSIYDSTLKMLDITITPDLIKGVRGTSNKNHLPEHFAKGILRAHHNIAVNKDGTTRYDMSEIPITHFKQKEIGTSIEKLKELGYSKDIHGNEISDENQIIEIKPQDVILPKGKDTLDAPATEVLSSIAGFVDDVLVKLYRLERFYKIKTPEDLVGHLIIGLAPHISAGIVGRIIGFSQTAGMLAHPLYHAAMRRDCDGDESCALLLMDALLNFSRQFLPDNRGGRTMDAPLVLTATLDPNEVDDMVHKVDVAWEYPLEFYEACQKITPPREIDIKRIGSFLGTPQQYEGTGFTHDTMNMNDGTHCSAYKTLPTIEEKLKGQMELARKIRAVDTADVARLVIEKHFMKDTRGNLRKFSTQKFRCSSCNESYRRPPLVGKCTKCGGKLIFTISEGSIVKYLEPSISLAEKFGCDDYLKDSLSLIKFRLESMFGKDKEKQTGLGAWFG